MRDPIELIYKKYFNDLYRFLFSLSKSHHTTEDLVQETFLRAFLYIKHDEESSIKSWLFTVAYNTYIDYYRKQKRITIKQDSYFKQIRNKDKTPEGSLLLNENIKEITQYLDKLTPKQKHAILLRDFHNLSYIEASKVMGVSLASFKVTLFRGRQTIRKMKESDIYE